MIFFFFFPPKRLKAEKLGHKPQNSSDQERVSVACLNKHNLHKIWLLCSKLSSKAIPKGFLLFHIPPRIHTMFRTAYTFSVIVCHEPTLLFWIHVWDNISGADRDQNVRSSGAWSCLTSLSVCGYLGHTHSFVDRRVSLHKNRSSLLPSFFLFMSLPARTSCERWCEKVVKAAGSQADPTKKSVWVAGIIVWTQL